MTAGFIRCENYENLSRLKLKDCFCKNVPCSNKLIGFVDLSDFPETWPVCLLDINALKCVGLL